MWGLDGFLEAFKFQGAMVIMNTIADGSRKTRKENPNTDDIDRSKVVFTTSQLPVEPSSILNIETADWMIPHVRIRLTQGGSNYNYSSGNVLPWTSLRMFQ